MIAETARRFNYLDRLTARSTSAENLAFVLLKRPPSSAAVWGDGQAPSSSVNPILRMT